MKDEKSYYLVISYSYSYLASFIKLVLFVACIHMHYIDLYKHLYTQYCV